MVKNNGLYILLILFNSLIMYLVNDMNMLFYIGINFIIWLFGYVLLIVIRYKRLIYFDRKLVLKYLLFYLINYFILFIFKIFSFDLLAIIVDLVLLLLLLYKKNYNNISSFIILLLFLDYSLFISLFSPNSPIANQLSYMDSAVFRYIGINMKNGLVPYRDVFDHKGILLYFINYIAALIDNNIGIWIINIICNFASLVFSYKLARLFSNKLVGLMTVLISFSIIPFVCSGGNYVEQYSIIFTVISLYLFFRDLIRYNCVKYTSVILISFCFGAVFLLRPNMVMLWVCMSFYLLIKYIYDKRYIYLIKSILLFLFGIVIFMLPFYIYLVSNNAFNDFIYDYFIFNFNYSFNYVEDNYFTVLFNFLLYSFQFIIIMVLGFIYLRNRSDINFIWCIIYMVLSFIIVIIPRNNYLHYLFVMIPTYIVPLAVIINNKKQLLTIFGYLLVFIFIVIGGKLIYVFNTVTSMDEVNVINKIVQEYSISDDDIFVYGNYANFYIVTDRLAPNKYLYQLSFYIDKKLFNDFISEINKKPPRIIISFSKISSENLDILFNNLDYNYSYVKTNNNVSIYCLME